MDINKMYLLILIGKEYWSCTLHSAKKGLFDWSGGRIIIDRFTKANPWTVDIKVVDSAELELIEKTYTKIE